MGQVVNLYDAHNYVRRTVETDKTMLAPRSLFERSMASSDLNVLVLGTANITMRCVVSGIPNTR